MKIKRNSWAFRLCKFGNRDLQHHRVTDTCTIVRSFIIGLGICVGFVAVVSAIFVYPMLISVIALGSRWLGVDVAVWFYTNQGHVVTLGITWWVTILVGLCVWWYIRFIKPLVTKGQATLYKTRRKPLTTPHEKWKVAVEWIEAAWGSLTNTIYRRVDID